MNLERSKFILYADYFVTKIKPKVLNSRWLIVFLLKKNIGSDMGRKIFLSFAFEDRLQVQGFRLLRWNNNVEVDFFF